MLCRTIGMALLFVVAVFGQTLTFDVASVKPSSGPHPAAIPPSDPISFSAPRMTLKLLIGMAYDVLNEQISGGPAWVNSDMFDVVAKAASPSTGAQKMQMLGSLLTDRFQLKFHRSPGSLRAYALIVSKDGLKIHPVKPDGPKPVPKPGGLTLQTSMKKLASIVGVYLTAGPEFPAPGEPPLTPPDPMPVIDQTGLEGDYDIVLDMTRSRDWFVVLEQQLGLKLEPRKVPIEMLIIDSAARPSGN